MKTITIVFIALLISMSSFAQGYGINYKAVIRDDSGNILTNQNLKVKFAILDLSDNVDYGATHTTTTDANGIIILNIGSGTEDVIGDYFALDWVNGFYRLRVEIDIAPYDTFVTLGTSAFQAVPLALSSLDNLWQFNNDNAIALGEKIGIGTDTPTELLHIYDEDKAGINLVVPSYLDQSQIEFRNGLETGFYSFYKILNRSDILRFELDADYTAAVGYESKMTLSNSGLALENGARINEFSTDGTLSGNSDVAVPTERAVKTYVDDVTSGSSSKTIVIPSVAFVASSANAIYFSGSYAGQSSGSGFLYAPLILPVGSTITSITAKLRDNDSSNNLEVSFLRAFNTSAIPSSFFTLSTTGSSSTGQTLTYTNPITISNNTQYLIEIRPVSNWGATDFGINNIQITYTE